MVLGMNRKLWTMLLGKDLNREAWPSGLGLASCTRLFAGFSQQHNNSPRPRVGTRVEGSPLPQKTKLRDCAEIRKDTQAS